jgi:ABC-2 type transport system ATP-binding protein
MPIVIEADELTKTFGTHKAVDHLTLRIGAGEIYGLVGSDGAGKTTTIRMLIGALKADSGVCSIAGYDIAAQSEEARSQVGYLSQRFSMYEDLTVLENIRFFAEVRGMGEDEWLPRSMEILEFVGLSTFRDRRASQLSGGMKQKLGLASALVARPRVLLLDEPTTGVDPVTRQDFWQLLVALVAGSRAAASAIDCSRVGFMRHGRIIAEDTPSQLKSQLAGRILELRGSPLRILRSVAQSEDDVEAVRAFGDRLHLRLAPGKSDAIAQQLANKIENEGGKVTQLRPIAPLLEDVFIYLSEQAYE